MFSSDADQAEVVDGDPTVAQYHASRARYIRTLTADVEKRLSETIGKRRAALSDEITNLSLLGHHRYEAYQVALKAYAVKAPARVTATGIISPMPTDRVIPGIDILYKAAIRAAEEYRECETIIKKRKAKIVEIDQKMRTQVEQMGRDLIAQLETPSGLRHAFQRDPLLERSHILMLEAAARRSNVLQMTQK